MRRARYRYQYTYKRRAALKRAQKISAQKRKRMALGQVDVRNPKTNARFTEFIGDNGITGIKVGGAANLSESVQALQDERKEKVMAKRPYTMTPARRAALKKAQAASARKRRGKGKGKLAAANRAADSRKRRASIGRKIGITAYYAAAGALMYRNVKSIKRDWKDIQQSRANRKAIRNGWQ